MKLTNTLLRGSFILVFALFTSSLAVAQRPDGAEMPLGTITGSVNDESGEQALEFATVAIYKVQDSSLVGGGITDVKGRFSVQARPGRYYLKIGFIGYGEKYISDVNLGRESMDLNLGEVKLAASDLRLDEVVVEAERTQMELQLDKKIYNIGKDLSNLGGSAAQLLSNLPSVAVDVDGNVSLRGSENVQILIDGKPSGLIGLSGSGGLQQLQGNLIERVEIITNPSARYDAEGGAGIINIILKKDKAKGFNGSFQVQAGYPTNRGASVNVNYRTGWINWFLNYGLTYRESPGLGYTNNYFFNSETYRNQSNERLRSDMSQNVRFGSDIYLNDKNTITLSASYRYSDEDNFTETRYRTLDANQNLTGTSMRVDNGIAEDVNAQYALNYSKTFAKRGQKLSFDVQFQDNNEVEGSIYEDTNPTNNIDQSNNDNGEKQIMLQSDYTHPIGKTGNIETGFRYTNRNIHNDYIAEDEVSPGNFTSIPDFTNSFNFDERVFASYFIFSNKVNKFSYQLGTRVEHTDMSTFLEQGNQRNKQNYLSLFPSTHFTYGFTDVSSVQLSYSRRISRPRFRLLNPFTPITDQTNINRGNPNLKPQFTDSYELGILNNWEKSTVYYGLYYRFTDQAVQRLQTEENGILTRMPQNLAVENSVGIEVNATRDFGKAFSTTGNFNFYHSTIESDSLYAETTTISARWGNNYKNEKLFDAQLNVWYQAPKQNAQGRQFGMASVDVGLSKDILKKNGTISMNVQDLFNTRKYKGNTVTDDFTSDFQFQWRKGPTMTVSLVYRLNQSKRQQRRGEGQNGGGEDFEGF